MKWELAASMMPVALCGPGQHMKIDTGMGGWAVPGELHTATRNSFPEAWELAFLVPPSLGKMNCFASR